MNYELLFGTILFISLTGMGIILWRKLPALAELPESFPEKEESFGSKLKKKIKEFNPLKSFSYEVLLQKIISKIRILTLKTDNQTFNWLQKLKEKVKRKELEEDNYWEELKKSTNHKDSPE